MKAAYYNGNKSFKIGESPKQSPEPEEVQIDVAYCGICGTDLHIFLGHMDKRVSIPQILGHEMSGIISEVGANVDSWKVGDRVVVRPLDYCGDCPACKAGHCHICQNLKFIGIDSAGALQKYWNVPAYTLHKLPDSVSLDKGALIEPLSVAYHDVRLSGVKEGDFVAVIGGGPIGILISLVAQIQKARVVLSEIKSFRTDFARQLGIEAVNPNEVDLPAFVEEQTKGAGADVVFEVSGTFAGASTMTQLPRTRGQIVIVGIFSEAPKVDLFRFFWRELKLCGARLYEYQDFEDAIQLVSSGQIPVEKLISLKYNLPEIQSALEQIESGADLMKVLIDIEGE